MKKIVVALCISFLLGVFSPALAVGSHKTMTGKELNLKYKETVGNDSFEEKREMTVNIYGTEHACTVTCFYDDGLYYNYDRVQIQNCDVAYGMKAAALVKNSDGESSGITSWALPRENSSKKSVIHYAYATTWTMYIFEQ